MVVIAAAGREIAPGSPRQAHRKKISGGHSGSQKSGFGAKKKISGGDRGLQTAKKK